MKRRRRRKHRRYALENPLNVDEFVVGGAVAVGVFFGYGLIDRALATRDGVLVKAPSAPIYSDVYRLGAGTLLTVAPLVGAHFAKDATLRSTLQLTGFAVLLGFGGKLVEDVAANLLKTSDVGKRLFPGEIYTQSALNAMVPTAGK